MGEIDIIARRRTLLIFVEVKARENLDDAAWSVTPRQRQRIAAAAEVWLAHNPDARIRDMRFDAMLVAPGRIPRHITAAFDTSGLCRSSHHCAARSFATSESKDTSNLLNIVWLWFRSSHFGFATRMMRTSEPPH